MIRPLRRVPLFLPLLFTGSLLGGLDGNGAGGRPPAHRRLRHRRALPPRRLVSRHRHGPQPNGREHRGPDPGTRRCQPEQQRRRQPDPGRGPVRPARQRRRRRRPAVLPALRARPEPRQSDSVTVQLVEGQKRGDGRTLAEANSQDSKTSQAIKGNAVGESDLLLVGFGGDPGAWTPLNGRQFGLAHQAGGSPSGAGYTGSQPATVQVAEAAGTDLPDKSHRLRRRGRLPAPQRRAPGRAHRGPGGRPARLGGRGRPPRRLRRRGPEPLRVFVSSPACCPLPSARARPRRRPCPARARSAP